MTQDVSQSIGEVSGLPVSPRRTRWRTIVLGLAILICGFAMGSATTVIVLKRMAEVAHTPGEVSKRIAERMKKRLGLSEEQMAKVSAILGDREKAVRSILKDIHPRLEKELQQTGEDVAAVLTPEQAENWRRRFDQVKQKWHCKWFPDLPRKNLGPDSD